MRFYGLSLSDVDSLTIEEFQQLQLAMPMIQSKEMLSLAYVLDFPHLNEKGRRGLVKRLNDIIRRSTNFSSGNKQTLTNSELFEKIAGVLGNKRGIDGE